jgi:hypothetical protein
MDVLLHGLRAVLETTLLLHRTVCLVLLMLSK